MVHEWWLSMHSTFFFLLWSVCVLSCAASLGSLFETLLLIRKNSRTKSPNSKRKLRYLWTGTGGRDSKIMNAADSYQTESGGD